MIKGSIFLLNGFLLEIASRPYLSEWEFNQLGGNLLNLSKFEGHDQLALAVFKLNTMVFPNSANTYGSYAYGLRATGKRKEAIQMYQKSIAMDTDQREW